MNRPTFDLPVLDISSSFDEWKEGVAVLVDKPAYWSSFRVIRVLRAFTGIRKIGHAGTLDPMATGLLICCIGRSATRRISEFVGLDKMYEGKLRLGQTTPSYDAETPVTERRPCEHISSSDLLKAFDAFTGEQTQKPPMYSAVKVEGRRLYKLAREGGEVDRPDRTVTIHEFSLLDKEGSDVTFRVACSKGTYIRTLVHDLGQRLGVGAHLIALRRTAVGPFQVEHAVPAETLLQKTR